MGAYLHLCTNNSNIDSIIGNCQKYFEPSGNIQFPRRSLLFNAGAACHKIILSFLAKLVGGECGNGDMKQVKNSLKRLYQAAAEEKVVVDNLQSGQMIIGKKVTDLTKSITTVGTVLNDRINKLKEYQNIKFKHLIKSVNQTLLNIHCQVVRNNIELKIQQYLHSLDQLLVDVKIMQNELMRMSQVLNIEKSSEALPLALWPELADEIMTLAMLWF